MTTRSLTSGDATFTVTRWADGLNFPEGPVWVPGTGLLFSDVHGARIYHARPEGGVEVWLDEGIKTNGMTLAPEGDAIYACDHGNRRLLHIDLATRTVTELTTGAMFGGLVNVNDVVVRPDGRVYFTDPDFPAAGKGTPVAQARHGVYSWKASEARKPETGILSRVAPTAAAAMAALPNGLAFGPDGESLYVAFSGEHTVRRYHCLPDGSLTGGDIALRLESGANPDGMAITDDGILWQTQYGNGRLDGYDIKSGRRVHALQLATGAVTNVAIEPNTNNRVFWITGAATPEDPGGKLWRMEQVQGK